MFNYLMYASTATHLMSDAALTALLENCRKNNQAASVTGMLLYKRGKFLQVLEGGGNLDALYQKIERDPRHNNIRMLLNGVQSKRQFPEWTMGFVNLSSLNEVNVPGFSSFFSDGFDVEAMRKNPRRAYQMLLRFRESA